MRPTMHSSQRSAGFTLLELAVVVLVITLLLGSLLIPLATQVDQRNVTETQKRLQEVKQALLAYAVANGRFPCPAGNQPTDIGTEKFAAGGNQSNGNCSNWNDGFVPGITLSLSNVDSDGYAVDAWGLKQNRIRYAVSHTSLGFPTTTNPFTSIGGMRAAGIVPVGQSSASGGLDLLYVCGAAGTATNCGTAPVLTKDAVFVIYSLGKNAATTGGASTDEAANLANQPVFVSKVNASAAATGEFDDLVLWGSRYEVINQLVAASQLP